MDNFEQSFRRNEYLLAVKTNHRFELRQCHIARLQNAPQLMLIKPLLFLLPSHDFILQRDPGILINHKYFEGSRAQSMNSVRLDLADTQHILKDSFLNLPLIFVSFLFILQI